MLFLRSETGEFSVGFSLAKLGFGFGTLFPENSDMCFHSFFLCTSGLHFWAGAVLFSIGTALFSKKNKKENHQKLSFALFRNHTHTKFFDSSHFLRVRFFFVFFFLCVLLYSDGASLNSVAFQLYLRPLTTKASQSRLKSAIRKVQTASQPIKSKCLCNFLFFMRGWIHMRFVSRSSFFSFMNFFFFF